MNLLSKLELKLWKDGNASPSLRIIRASLAILRIVFGSRLKLHASSLTHTTLLTIVPIMAISFAVLKSFGLSKYLQKAVDKILIPMGDSGIEVSKYLSSFVSNTQTSLLSGISVAFLFYSAFTLLSKIEVSLNHIWLVENKRKLKNQVIGYLGTVLLTIIIIAATFSLKLYLSGIDTHFTPFLGKVFFYFLKVISILLAAFLLATLYKSIPNTFVKFSSAYSGGLFVAISWIPLTSIFTKIINLSSSISIIYAGFISIILLLIWINILWLLFLYGALVSYFIQYPKLLRPHSSRDLNPSEIEYFSVMIKNEFINYFEGQKGELSIIDLINKTNLSYMQVFSVIQIFRDNKVIICTDKQSNSYVLSTPIKILTDEFIIQVVRGKILAGAKNKAEAGKEGE